MVFFRFFLWELELPFFPKNNNMIHRYYCIVMLHPDLPYISDYRQIQDDSHFPEAERQVSYIPMIFLNGFL